ncbi:MAG: hypothetical protein ACI807_000859 [Paracoccaceae bacterium]|jgi:hypothetical protein
MRFVRSLALGLALFAGGWSVGPLMQVQAQSAANPSKGQSEMADLQLSLSIPSTPVLAGEDFVAVVTATNGGAAPIEAPAELDEAAYAFVLTPENGDPPIGLSLDAQQRMPAQGQPRELNFPSPSLGGDLLAPGVTREATFYPARLAPRALPPGAYAMTVVLVTDRAVTSAPQRLVIAAAQIEKQALSPRGIMGGVDLAFVHRDPDGHGFLFQGIAKADAPTRAAALRVADLGMAGPVQIALARRAADAGGPAWAAWLTADGTFAAALSYSAYVAGRVAPLDLGLADASLGAAGLHDPETDTRATFAALGIGAGGLELVVIRLDANAGWSADVTRTPVDLPGTPTHWRLVPRADGGHEAIVAMAAGGATSVHAIAVALDGTGAPPRLLSEAPLPLAAMSAPLAADDGDMVHLLFGPQITDRARMVFRRAPLSGEAPTELVFRVPMENGATPSGWAMAEGASGPAVMAAWLSPRLLGLTIGDGSEGGILRSDIEGGADLSVLAVGPKRWAIWRNAQGAIESHLFP